MEAKGNIENGSEEMEQYVDCIDEQEYETQLLGFTPKSFSDGVYNTVFETVYELMKFVKKLLIEKFKDVMSEEEIGVATQKILDKIMKKANIASDKLEVYLLGNVFTIPKHVILPEDSVHCSADAEIDDIDRETKQLMEKIHHLSHINSTLKDDFKEYERIKEQYKQALEQVTKLRSSDKENGVLDWSDMISFNAQKSQRLLRIIKDFSSNMVKDIDGDTKAGMTVDD